MLAAEMSISKTAGGQQLNTLGCAKIAGQVTSLQTARDGLKPAPTLRPSNAERLMFMPLELLRQPADFGFKRGKVVSGVGEDGAEAGVKFDGAGLLHNLGNRGGGDAGAGDN